jgi:hypothetical protein
LPTCVSQPQSLDAIHYSIKYYHLGLDLELLSFPASLFHKCPQGQSALWSMHTTPFISSVLLLVASPHPLGLLSLCTLLHMLQTPLQFSLHISVPDITTNQFPLLPSVN